MDVIVIGGGASGLVSAIVSKRCGNNVTIIERNDKVGKKLLLTGNGKCNYWNNDFTIDHFRSSNIDLANELINSTNQKKVLDFFDSIGIIPSIKNGYYYPMSNTSTSVQNALLLECKNLGVNILYNILVDNIDYKNNKYIVNNVYTCDKVILSTGSKATPKTGSDGIGYELVKKFNHTVLPILPALVQLKSDINLKDWDGIRLNADVSLYENNKLIKKETGEVQLTSYGISGICVFQLSGLVSNGLYNKLKEHLEINFLPFVDDYDSFINNRSNTLKNRTIVELLESVINYKLLYFILKKCNISNKEYNLLSSNERELLKQNLTKFRLNIIGTNDYNNAQTCTGGVPLSEININTMESKLQKGLYLTGEVLDINGDCGGYNLGYSWITGILAGEDND